MRSLRFRLPAIFLAGVVLAGIVTAVVAIRLFQDYTERQTVNDLRRQARELAALYEGAALQAVDEGARAPTFAAPRLEAATGTRLYYVGTDVFPGQISGLRSLTLEQAGLETLPERPTQIEFTPPGADQVYHAVAEPVGFGGETFGELVVARPRAELGASWVALLWRVAIAIAVGLAVAAGLFLYLSRRLTRPVLALSRAADEVAKGRYDVDVPELRSGDEIAELADRFREMTRRLSEADLLERHFLMSVSHELRTPLTAIRGHVGAMRDGLASDPEARDASLEVVQAEAERLSRLVGDLLDLAKLDANRFTLVEEEVDLGQLAEQAYQSFAEEARARSIRFERTVATAPTLRSDGDRVLQIVSNLLANAFEWTPDGGEVSLRLEIDGRRACLSVSDSGPGVSPEERDRVFRPFWSRNGHGTGLGLAIAHELAEALGGHLELDTGAPRGASFRLLLPTA